MSTQETVKYMYKLWVKFMTAINMHSLMRSLMCWQVENVDVGDAMWVEHTFQQNGIIIMGTLEGGSDTEKNLELWHII